MRTSRFRVHEWSRCLSDLDAKFRRYAGISHDAQKEIERRYIRIGRSGGESSVYEGGFLVWCALLSSATPFAQFRSSRHCYFCYFLSGVMAAVPCPCPGLPAANKIGRRRKR